MKPWQLAFRNEFYQIWANTNVNSKDSLGVLTGGVTSITVGPITGDIPPTEVTIGSYKDQMIDADDIAAVGNADPTLGPQFGAAVLIHELVEEFEGQIKGVEYAAAHEDGIIAESKVVGLDRQRKDSIRIDKASGIASIVVTYKGPTTTLYLSYKVMPNEHTIQQVHIGPDKP